MDLVVLLGCSFSFCHLLLYLALRPSGLGRRYVDVWSLCALVILILLVR